MAISESYYDHSLIGFISWSVFRLVMNVLLNFYALYNIKNVNFKLYLEAILFGYEVGDPLENASIFIIKRKINEDEYSMETRLITESLTESSSLYDEMNVDSSTINQESLIKTPTGSKNISAASKLPTLEITP